MTVLLQYLTALLECLTALLEYINLAMESIGPAIAGSAGPTLTPLSLYSDSFYTHYNGYRMCLHVDPHGYIKLLKGLTCQYSLNY